ELIHAIAEESGASEELLRSLDEHARNNLEDMIQGILMGVAYTESEYFKHLLRVVHTISRHGRAVLVGRGANFILTQSPALRVRAVCRADIRVRRIMEVRGLSQHDAEREVAHVDRERAHFMKRHYKADVADPTGYDVLVNTGTLPIDSAVDVVAAGYRAKF